MQRVLSVIQQVIERDQEKPDDAHVQQHLPPEFFKTGERSCKRDEPEKSCHVDDGIVQAGKYEYTYRHAQKPGPADNITRPFFKSCDHGKDVPEDDERYAEYRHRYKRNGSCRVVLTVQCA